MSALSRRGAHNVGTYISHVPTSLLEAVDDKDWIDLSMAENYTIRQELLEVNMEAAVNAATAKDLNWPHGFFGEARLLTALSSLFNTYFAPAKTVRNEDVVLTTGAAGALDTLAWSICDSGDGVLMPCPYHAGAYEVFLNVHTGVVPVPVSARTLDDVFGDGLIPTLEKGLQEAQVKIKALLIATPHNPLGRCYSKESLVQLMQFCQRHNLHLISDEVFALSEHGCEDLRGPRHFTSALSIEPASIGVDPDRVHAIWSMSKDLGATGVRLGCVVTRNRDLRCSIALVSHIHVSNLSILFSRELLTSARLHDLIQLSASRLSVGYKSMVALFEAEAIEYLPSVATTFVLARLAPHSKSLDDDHAAARLYQQQGVLFFSAADYHMPTDFTLGWMRVSFAVAPDRLENAMARIKVAYRRYLGEM